MDMCTCISILRVCVYMGLVHIYTNLQICTYTRVCTLHSQIRVHAQVSVQARMPRLCQLREQKPPGSSEQSRAQRPGLLRPFSSDRNQGSGERLIPGLDQKVYKLSPARRATKVNERMSEWVNASPQWWGRSEWQRSHLKELPMAEAGKFWATKLIRLDYNPKCKINIYESTLTVIYD